MAGRPSTADPRRAPPIRSAKLQKQGAATVTDRNTKRVGGSSIYSNEELIGQGGFTVTNAKNGGSKEELHR